LPAPAEQWDAVFRTHALGTQPQASVEASTAAFGDVCVCTPTPFMSASPSLGPQNGPWGLHSGLSSPTTTLLSRSATVPRTTSSSVGGAACAAPGSKPATPGRQRSPVSTLPGGVLAGGLRLDTRVPHCQTPATTRVEHHTPPGPHPRRAARAAPRELGGRRTQAVMRRALAMCPRRHGRRHGQRGLAKRQRRQTPSRPAERPKRSASLHRAYAPGGTGAARSVREPAAATASPRPHRQVTVGGLTHPQSAVWCKPCHDRVLTAVLAFAAAGARGVCRCARVLLPAGAAMREKPAAPHACEDGRADGASGPA
jgi:hypothetical protein